MKKTTGRILKASNVKLEGRFHLDTTQIDHCLPKKKNTASVIPQARVVEKHPEFAIIEITCPSGTIMHLKCEYAGAETPADQAPDQTK